MLSYKLCFFSARLVESCPLLRSFSITIDIVYTNLLINCRDVDFDIFVAHRQSFSDQQKKPHMILSV